MMLTATMFFRPPWVALRGKRTGKARAPSRRAATSAIPEAMGRAAVKKVVT